MDVIEAGLLETSMLTEASCWLFTLTITATVALVEVNLLVSQIRVVEVDDKISQTVLSSKVTETVFPSSREAGKLVPTMVSLVPPLGFTLVLGETDVTVRL